VIGAPLPGAGQDNPKCKDAEHFPPDQTENLRSLGVLITFGKLRILDLGDLTRDKEAERVCPRNKLGLIDIFVVSHHGWYQSNSLVLLNGIAPRVAVMDNGAKKGGTPSAWDIIEKSPGLRVCGSCTFLKRAVRRTMLPRNSLPIQKVPMRQII
jgi:hypothetical protein